MKLSACNQQNMHKMHTSQDLGVSVVMVLPVKIANATKGIQSVDTYIHRQID